MRGKKSLPLGITVWDILLAAVFASAAAAVLLFSLAPGSGGGSVEITSGGALIGTYSLYEDREISVENGGFTNVVSISGGAVRVSSATCPDLYCVRHREIRYKNECIVCLPARLVVTVTGGEGAPFDAYTG